MVDDQPPTFPRMRMTAGILFVLAIVLGTMYLGSVPGSSVHNLAETGLGLLLLLTVGVFLLWLGVVWDSL